MPVIKLYQVDLGRDPQDCNWVAAMHALADEKVNVMRGTKLGPLLTRVTKSIRKKQRKADKFPLPGESPRIITVTKKPVVIPHIIPPNGG